MAFAIDASALHAVKATRTFVAMLRRPALALLALAAGCSTTTQLPDSNLTVTEPGGANPLTGRSLTIARAYFQQELPNSPEDYVESPIANGTFDLTVPIGTYSAPIIIRVALSSLAGIELVGATPSYYPAESTRLKVLVGAPGSCGIVAGIRLATARSASGGALIGSYALISGGEVAAGDSGAVDALDLLTYTQYALTPAPASLGPTRSAPINRVSAIVVSTARPPYVHRLFAADATTGRPEPTLHAGAQSADAVLAAGTYGAVVVGGGTDLAPSNQLSWIGPIDTSTGLERVVPATLSAAAAERAAFFADNGLWIASSDGVTTTLEQVAPFALSSDVRVAFIADGVRRGASLVFDRAGANGLLFGGKDENDMPRSDSVAISGCPAACVVSAGPTWAQARVGAVVEASGVIVGGTPASSLVEYVHFDGATPTFETFAFLVSPRSEPSVVRYPGGVVVVIGGDDLSVPRDDIEVCFPPL